MKIFATILFLCNELSMHKYRKPAKEEKESGW